MDKHAMTRVLVVDDDRVVRLVLHDTVQRMGSTMLVDSAASGAEALAMLESDVYDLLITDLRLPGLNGIELTEEIRKQDQHLPVIWITAYANYATDEQARRLNVYSCLRKPLGISEIRTAVLEALGSEDGCSADDDSDGESD
jgi:CheY-like chemotaxis protein